jgi:hypothetical protein
MRRGTTRLLRGLTVAGLSILVCSCGEKGETLEKTGASLEGSVLYGDEPVHFALIIATSPSGSATSNIDEEGKYHMTNVPLGEVSIAVNTKAGYGDFMTKTMSKAYEKKGIKPPKYIQVPEKYHEPTTTPLKKTIDKGPNTFDIKIPK